MEKRTKTYGDFTREEIDRIVSSPEFPAMMERAQKRMDDAEKRMDDRMAELVRKEVGRYKPQDIIR